jgi:ribosomal protein S18 acetylase RimI-like enzyme
MLGRLGAQIRVATHADLPKLEPIWLEFVEYHARLGDKFKYYPEEWPQVLDHFARSLQQEQSALFVAEFQGKIIGYIYGFIFDNNPGFHPRRVGFIRDLAVSEEFTNQGVGRSLVFMLEHWFSERDIEVVQLYVAIENDGGLETWKRFGYENYLIGMWKELG